MKRRRVKITGIGPVTPAGIGREAFWKGILEPVSRVKALNRLGDEFGAFVAAQVGNFDLGRLVSDRSRLPKGMSRQSQFAVAGAMLALKDAGISEQDFRASNAAVVTGSSLMDFGGIVSSIDAVSSKGIRGAQTRTLYSTGVSSVPSAINYALDANARTMAVSTQCCAGMDAIGLATELVATGQADLALCGGSEAPLHRFPMLEFRAGEMTPASSERPEKMSRPFDLWRTTGVVSEGACILVLEPENSSRPGYCLVGGYAFANDSDELCDGLVSSARLALAAAGRRPADVEVLNAWGPGHRLIDVAEAQAMVRVLGASLLNVSAVSIKGSIGMPLAAAPAIQAASAALGLTSGDIPPTVNWEFADPMCPLNLSPKARRVEHSVSLLNAHGVGGVNASLVLEKC